MDAAYFVGPLSSSAQTTPMPYTEVLKPVAYYSVNVEKPDP